MAHEAIKALKERNGSSVQAIKKHIITTYPAIAFTPHQLRSSLKKGTEAGKFVKVGILEVPKDSLLFWKLFLSGQHLFIVKY